jgi:signal peptidase II
LAASVPAAEHRVSDDRSPEARSPARGLLGLTIAVAALVVVLDQLTKWWALERLVDGDIDVVWTLRFRLAFNSGMAFSQGRGLGPVIGALGLVVVVVLVVSARKGTSKVGAVAVGMVIGGAAGNLLDRLFRSDDGLLQGRVVDFIDFQWWPVFNVADMAIVIGGILLVVSAWSGTRQPAQ